MLNPWPAFSFASPAVSCYGHRANQLLIRIGLAVAVTAWVRNVEAEHAEHQEHLKKENDGHLPEVPAYEHLNRRAKPFPWGPNSLFFNPHVRI